MSEGENKMLTLTETTCGTLLNELQVDKLMVLYRLHFRQSSFFHLFFAILFSCSYNRNQLLLLFMCQLPYFCQIIWEEVGESNTEKDRMLLEIERECLEVYRRKVDQANKCRAQLRQAIADAEAELAAICSSIGEPPVHIRQVSL